MVSEIYICLPLLYAAFAVFIYILNLFYETM